MEPYLSFEKSTIAPVALDYKQLLLFTTSEEEMDETGRAMSVTFEREVEVNHTGRTEDRYKFQVFLFDAAYTFSRTTEPYHTLYRKTSYVFDELVLWADPHGHLMEVHNLPFVQYRWETIREELILEFEGDVFEEHVAFMDDILADEPKLLQYLSTPSMYGLYFNGCWGSYKNGESSDRNVTYGKELQNITVIEDVTLQAIKNTRLVKLAVAAKEKSDQFCSYLGNYTYLDNILDQANKIVGLNPNKTIKYSAKWVGLKSIIP